ncbi:MAG: aldehyde dehydrogenase family protein, partial [Phototrophicaceae bacterium]
MLTPFTNEPLTDFSRPENVAAFEAALDLVKSEIGRTYPLVIGGERITLDETFPSLNPARPDEVLGYFSKASEEHAEQAVQAAVKGFETWKRVPAEERARYLL